MWGRQHTSGLCGQLVVSAPPLVSPKNGTYNCEAQKAHASHSLIYHGDGQQTKGGITVNRIKH